MRREEERGTAGAELDPFEVAKQRVKGSVPAIVEAMVERAKQGSCTHAKTLLEMTGAKHMFDGEARGTGERRALGEAGAGTTGRSGGRESASLQQEAQEAQ